MTIQRIVQVPRAVRAEICQDQQWRQQWVPVESATVHSFCMIRSKPAKRIHRMLRTDGFWVAGCFLVLFFQEHTVSWETLTLSLRILIESHCLREGECLLEAVFQTFIVTHVVSPFNSSLPAYFSGM